MRITSLQAYPLRCALADSSMGTYPHIGRSLSSMSSGTPSLRTAARHRLQHRHITSTHYRHATGALECVLIVPGQMADQDAAGLNEKDNGRLRAAVSDAVSASCRQASLLGGAKDA